MTMHNPIRLSVTVDANVYEVVLTPELLRTSRNQAPYLVERNLHKLVVEAVRAFRQRSMVWQSPDAVEWRWSKFQLGAWLNGEMHLLIPEVDYPRNTDIDNVIKRLRQAAWRRRCYVDIRVMADQGIWIQARPMFPST